MNIAGHFSHLRLTFFGMTLVFCCVSAIATQPEKLKLKGVMPGMTLEQVEEVVPGFAEKCAVIGAAKVDEICTYRAATNRMFEPAHLIPLETLADITPISWSFFGSDGVIKSLSVVFSANYFSGVTGGLSAKFGKPKVTYSITQNRMGAKFENTKMTWTRGTQTLIADRYGLDLETSLLVLTDSVHKSAIKLPSKDL